MASTVSDQISEIKTRIEALCRETFKNQPAILLSELGVALGADLAQLKLLTGKKLTEFLSEQFSGIFRVTRIANRGNAYIVVPAEMSDEDVARISVEEIKPKSEHPDTGPRFRPVFWAAFSKPIAEGRRFLCTDPLEFVDLKGDPPEGPNWREVPSEFIPPEGIDHRDLQISENIQRWLADNGLSSEQFRLHAGGNDTTSGTRRVTLLHALISSLDLDQQREISLPLDVVRKLMSRSVSL